MAFLLSVSRQQPTLFGKHFLKGLYLFYSFLRSCWSKLQTALKLDLLSTIDEWKSLNIIILVVFLFDNGILRLYMIIRTSTKTYRNILRHELE